MDERDLKPCPFCGGVGPVHPAYGQIRHEPKLEELSDEEPFRWRAICYGCKAAVLGETQESVFNRWNRRPESKEGILLEAVERALERYNDPREPHNGRMGGFPRGELGWAMADDLRTALKKYRGAL